AAQFIVMGNDNKNDGLGKDQVMIFDIANSGAPKVVATLNLENSVAGPPTNVAVVPGNRIALVANALHATEEQGQRKTAPDTHLYIIDLTTSPPQLLNTIEIGKQPSGMAVNKAGDLALVALRADNAMAVLSINGKEVKLIDTVAMGDSPATAT